MNKLSFDMDEKDYAGYIRAVLDVVPEYGRKRTQVRVLGAIGLGCIGGALAIAANGDMWMMMLAGAIWAAAILVLLFYPRYYNKRVVAVSMQVMNKPESRNLFGPRELELTEQGVQTHSAIGQAFFRAEAITKVVVTPAYLLLFISSAQAIIVPKAKIAPGEFEEAVGFAQKWYGKG